MTTMIKGHLQQDDHGWRRVPHPEAKVDDRKLSKMGFENVLTAECRQDVFSHLAQLQN